jgi:hypothetical protein
MYTRFAGPWKEKGAGKQCLVLLSEWHGTFLHLEELFALSMIVLTMYGSTIPCLFSDNIVASG